MNLPLFLDGYPSVLFGSESDDVFTFFRLSLYGMCSIRLAKLLNYASRYLENGECYLEVGTYAGFTLLSAGYESGRRFVGIDNFSENYSVTGKVRDKLEENLQKHPGSYLVVDSDFRKVDLASVLSPFKAGVFLVDGKHTYEDVIDSVAWAKPSLAANAVILFDDINVPGVKKAVDEIKQDSAFEEVFFANSFFDAKRDFGMSSDKYIHNGFSMVVYRA